MVQKTKAKTRLTVALAWERQKVKLMNETGRQRAAATFGSLTNWTKPGT